MNKVKSFLAKNRSTIAWITVLFAFRWSMADQYRVPSASMAPTIVVGDHILTNKMAYEFKLPFTDWVLTETGAPQKGDIIIFITPTDNTTNFVKRITGVPGDIVEDQYGNKLTVPPDEYFVMGDNRDNSFDSRYWGFVPRKNIKGKVLSVLWNINFDDGFPQVQFARIGKALD